MVAFKTQSNDNQYYRYKQCRQGEITTMQHWIMMFYLCLFEKRPEWSHPVLQFNLLLNGHKITLFATLVCILLYSFVVLLLCALMQESQKAKQKLNISTAKQWQQSKRVLLFPCFLGSIVSPAHKWFYCDHASGDYNINTYSAPFRSGLLYMPIANTHAYTSTTPQSENHHIKAIYNTKKTFKQRYS